MRTIVVSIICLLPSLLFGNVRINEVVQSNVNGIMDDLNEFPDSWVEIFNEDTVSFDFTDYSVGLTRDFNESYPILDSTIIAPNGFLLIYCDKEYDGLHTDFRLDVDGCSLYLFDKEGSIVDSMVVPEMLAPDIAYGRITDGSDSLSYFRKATPGAKNEGFCTNRILKKPKFSVKGGVFRDPVVLRLSLQGDCPSDAVIRYTTNGSEPTENSPIAPDSISIEETMIIRAKTFSDSALSKESKTESYLFLEREQNLPVFSIVTDSMYLWDWGVGIYKSFVLNAGKRRPANFEYFVDGTSVINQLGEMNIGGNVTRGLDMKSLVVRANKRFGEKRFKYKFWNSKEIDKAKTLYLRNAGNDNSVTYMRDALIQMATAPHFDMDWSAYQPCILYVNGEYFGLMNLRERSNEDNIWSNYDGLENIDCISQVKGDENEIKSGDDLEWQKVETLLRTDSCSFSQVDELIDVGEFQNFIFINSLFCNLDFPGNNTVFWRERKPNSKWRWIIKDTDWGLGISTPFFYDYLNYLTRISPFDDKGHYLNCNPESASVKYRNFLSIPEVANSFVDKNVVYMGTFLTQERFLGLTDSLASNIKEEISFMNSWSRNPIDGDWNSHVEDVKLWYWNRYPYYIQHLANFFALGDTTSLTIKSVNRGQIYFNGVKVEDNHLEGKYFHNRVIYLSESDTAFSYSGDSIVIAKEDSLVCDSSKYWIVNYEINGGRVTNNIMGSSLYFIIPEDARNVVILDSFVTMVPDCDLIQDVRYFVKEDDCGLSYDNLNIPNGFDSFGDILPQRNTDGVMLGFGVTSIEWSYVNSLNDTVAVCPQQIVVVDTFAPVLEGCESLDTLVLYTPKDACAVSSEMVLSNAPNASDNCGLITGTLKDTERTYGFGSFTLSWRFADVSGNLLTCQQTLVVKDSSAPYYEHCASMPTLHFTLKNEKSGIPYSEMDLETPMAIDNCSNVYGKLVAEDEAKVGENLIFWFFSDEQGNASFCKQEVIVTDSFPPYLENCYRMPNLSVDMESHSCGLPIEQVTLNKPIAFDNDGSPVVGQLAFGDSLWIGENSLNWYFVDAAGNEITCPQVLEVIDAFPPVYDACDSIPYLTFRLDEVELDEIESRLMQNVPVASDNCGVTIYGNLPQEVEFYLGENRTWWQFADGAGNSLLCPQMVIVEYGSSISTDRLVDASDDDVFVGPNPMNEVLVVKGVSSSENVKVYNVDGQLILTAKIVDSKAQIDVSGLESGVYFVSVLGHFYKVVKI